MNTSPEHITELAGVIAEQAQAIADGRIRPELFHAAVLRIAENVDTLKAWTAEP